MVTLRGNECLSFEAITTNELSEQIPLVLKSGFSSEIEQFQNVPVSMMAQEHDM